MRGILRWIRNMRRPRDTLITVSVYRDRLLHNLHTFQKTYPEAPFAPVLKSNAYGHGLIEVAMILDSENLPFFVVDSYYEARLLRMHGIKTPLLVIGYTPAELMAKNRLHDVSFTITSIEELRSLAAYTHRPISLHLKIDTGMHRHGILPDEVEEATHLITSHSKLLLEGACSHLADAEVSDSTVTGRQLSVWRETMERIRSSCPTLRYVHLANTAATAFAGRAGVNVHRLGLGLYGMDERSDHALDLQPALSIETIITSVRTIEPGETVGYNATFTAQGCVRIATIPVGYAEGLNRRLSGKGVVLVRDVICPIVGRVSMNITSVDVSAVPGVKMGDRVTVLSAEAGAPNSAEAIAALCGTIQRDILVGIPRHLRRVAHS